jgi:hypothetical protein
MLDATACIPTTVNIGGVLPVLIIQILALRLGAIHTF